MQEAQEQESLERRAAQNEVDRNYTRRAREEESPKKEESLDGNEQTSMEKEDS